MAGSDKIGFSASFSILAGGSATRACGPDGDEPREVVDADVRITSAVARHGTPDFAGQGVVRCRVAGWCRLSHSTTHGALLRCGLSLGALAWNGDRRALACTYEGGTSSRSGRTRRGGMRWRWLHVPASTRPMALEGETGDATRWLYASRQRAHGGPRRASADQRAGRRQTDSRELLLKGRRGCGWIRDGGRTTRWCGGAIKHPEPELWMVSATATCRRPWPPGPSGRCSLAARDPQRRPPRTATNAPQGVWPMPGGGSC